MLNNLKIATWMDSLNLSCGDNYSPCAIPWDQSKEQNAVSFKPSWHCYFVVIIEL